MLSYVSVSTSLLFNDFLKDFIYLFSERGEGRQKERERNINVWLPLVCAPFWGPGPQPSHMPWLGIKLVTLGLQAGTQSTEPCQPRLFLMIFNDFYHILFIHSLVGGHLDSSQFLAAMNICVLFFVWTYACISLRYISRSRDFWPSWRHR